MGKNQSDVISGLNSAIVTNCNFIMRWGISRNYTGHRATSADYVQLLVTRWQCYDCPSVFEAELDERKLFIQGMENEFSDSTERNKLVK